jgi:uncharacterized protein YchJ
MNTSTGELVSGDILKSFSPEKQNQFVPVKRDLTVKEAADMRIRLYAPCACGSGKKFKFCCHKK